MTQHVRGTGAGATAAAGYNPALDGLRALAVLAVLGYHMNDLGGGYLGVDVFLVLSGFLITGLLLAEWDRTGRVSLARFYVRRAYRLLPAFFVFVVVGAVLVVAIKSRADQHDFLANAVTSVLYVNNYYRVFRPESGGAWFGHTWSLSLEEQFYLIWPLVLVLLCRRPAARRRLPAILLGAAVVILLWREVLIGFGAGDTRLYFGLDTRADALLMGCALAAWARGAGALVPRQRDGSDLAFGLGSVAGHTRRPAGKDGSGTRSDTGSGRAGAAGGARWPVRRGGSDTGAGRPAASDRLGGAASRSFRASWSPRSRPRLWALLGPVALVLLMVGTVTAPAVGNGITWLDLGGFTLVAALAGLVILAVDQQRTGPLARVLGSRPMAWLGRISYAFYLWHFPVAGTVRDRLGDRLGAVPLLVLAISLSIGLAAASTYLVERPAQRRRPRWAASPSAPAALPAVPAPARPTP